MKALAIVGLLAGLMSSTAFAECFAPAPAADPPNGATASRDEMLAAQKAIKAYHEAVVVFADCVKKSGGISTRADDAMARLQKLADRFNVELRVFKQKSGA
jgi:hypothetical protein